MQDPGNAALCLVGPNSALSGFKDIKVSEVVETTCSSTRTGRETPETLARQSKGLHPNFSKGLFEPIEDDIRIHGIYEAKRRAGVNGLNIALEAIRKSWGYRSAECYRDAARKAGLETALERALLNWDIQQSNPHVLKSFMQNLLFLCLNMLDHYDTPPCPRSPCTKPK